MSESTRPATLRMVLQMLGGAAITVAVLLPLYLIDRQATNLAIAKLEMELAHAGVPATAAPVPASTPAPAPSAPPPPVVILPSPPSSHDAELAQVTRALSDLAKRVEGVAAPSTPARATEPVNDERSARPNAARAPLEAPRSAGLSERHPRLSDLRIKVYYESRCLGLAVDVAERLLALGADPELIESRQTRNGVSRLIYMGGDQAESAEAIADGLSPIIPVDIEPDTSGAAAGGPRLELAGIAACQRPR